MLSGIHVFLRWLWDVLRHLAILGAIGATSSHSTPLPSFDPIAHPYIKLASTNKAVFSPGASGNVLVTLRNPHPTPFAASIIVSIFHDTMMIAHNTTSVDIPAVGTTATTVPFIAPARGEHGYRVDVTLKNLTGRVVDDAATAIDVQNSPLHARFPRQCWVSHWDGSLDAASLIASQVAWYCNTLQGYALYYRPEMAPPNGLASWPSLSNLTVQRSAIKNIVAAAHAANVPVGFFQGTGEAYANWPNQTIKPLLAWGSFRTPCGRTHTCTPDDLERFPKAPETWAKFKWQASHLDFFDPCSVGWQQFLLERSIRPMIDQFGFDFWQADTVGAPAQPTFDNSGVALDTAQCLTSFTSAAALRLGKPVVLNNVSGWGMLKAAAEGTQPYLYRETWDFDSPYYPALNAIVSGSPGAIRSMTGRAIVQPAYINRDLADQCSIGARTADCRVNANTALLATAMFAMAGSTWMNHPDAGCIATNVFIEGYHLPCSATLVSDLLAYKAFEVGYEDMLRDTVSDSNEPCMITAGGKGSDVGAAGAIYLLGKRRSGFQICHLLNLTGVSSNDWTDLHGTKERPITLERITMKLYYNGEPKANQTHKLWWASPDYAAGASQALSYTVGSDAAGKYVLFSLPSLSYWDMVVFETTGA